MTFQWVIDNAESIVIDRRPVVASTQSRSGVSRTVSRGGDLWRFEVQLPAGIRWTDARQAISKYEAIGRTNESLIRINNPGHEWLYKYQGDLTNTSGVTCTIPSSGNTITINSGATLSSGYIFRAGDLIQLGTNGSVYSVAADVAAGTTTIKLNRPIRESAGTTTLLVANNCFWKVICTEMPSFNLFARDQVSWTGPFIFYESIV